MHCAVRRAVHAVSESIDARTAQPTVASTWHVALHSDRHRSAHVDCVFELQSFAHSPAHCPLQKDAQPGSTDERHSVVHCCPHRVGQLAAQSAFAPASH
jgi:hypothetical protein